MAIFTVHQPPPRAAGASPDPVRFVFVRDGFYVWAFLLTWLWMLWHRLWLVLLIYLVAMAGIEYGLHYLNVGPGGIAVALLLVSFLIGLEGSTLRRFTLARRGWRHVGVVEGGNLEAAERRFFDAWTRGRPPEPPRAVPPPLPRTPQPSDIVGLFPEPGVPS